MFSPAFCAPSGRRRRGKSRVDARFDSILLDAIALESRVMLSVTPMPTDGAEVELTLLEEAPTDADSLDLPSSNEPTLELIFIDTSLRDYQLLLDGLAEDQTGRDFEIILLDDAEDGIEQIGDELSKFDDIDAIHILSHGSQSGVQLGSTWLRMENLDDHADDLSIWSQSLSSDADLLFYGCELAGNDTGQSLLAAIQNLTGADVAASTNNTGSSIYGVDWELEFTKGSVDTTTAIGGDVQDAWNYLMATINVTTTDDVVNGDTTSVAALIANPGADGISLREAILAANADSGADTINLTAGVYTLSIAGDMEDSAATGDLDITSNVTIIGDAAPTTIIDGNGIDRVLHVVGHGASLSNLTIRDGFNSSDGLGGGIYNQAALYMDDVIVRDNVSIGQGGGIYDDGLIIMGHSAVINNQAHHGAGIYHSPTAASSMTLTISTISGNTATGSGGGLFDGNGTNLNAVTIAHNSAANGGGIHTTGIGATVFNTIVASNTASVGTDVSGTIQSSGWNLIGVSAGGSGYQVSDLLDVDARLNPVLTATLGSTPTHQLYSDSPAVDAANIAATPLIDQVHQSRLVDGDGDTIDEVDIGAFEYQPLDTNLPPEDITLSNSLVDDGTDTTGGYTVGTLNAFDPDAPETLTYLVVGGVDESSFQIAGASMDELVLDDGVLDLATQSSYDVMVRVTDSEGNYYEETLTVEVTPVNFPPSVSFTNIVSIAEDLDTTNSVKVADIVVSDDGLGTNSLRLTGDDEDLFVIVGDEELHIKAGVQLNFEMQPFLDVTVEVDDALVGGDPDDSVSHSFEVTDVNEAPSLSLAYIITSLPEDTETTDRIKVADIEIIDDALGTNTLRLSDDDIFEIVNDTEVYIKAGTELDFETQPTLTVSVEIDDLLVGGTPDDSELLSVSISDVNEAATVSLINLVPISENTDTSNSVKVADIEVIDDLLGTNTLSLSGADEAVFVIVNSNELHIRANTELNFENQSSYDVTVSVDDLDVTGTPDDSVNFTLTLSDENESPLMDPEVTLNVDENTVDVTVVSALDPDGDTVLYSITGGLDQDLFTVNQHTGLLSFNPPPDFEEPKDSDGDNTYHVEITATDELGLTATQQLTITVDPVNDSLPVFVSNSTVVIIAGNTEVVVVQATDADLPASLITYEILGGPDAGAFKLNPITGELAFNFVPSANFPKDVDGNNIYEVIVQADDNQGGLASQFIRVLVRPDPPPVATDDVYTVGNDGTLVVDAATGVLANDFDPDGKSLQAHVHQQPDHGTLVLRSDGSFVYIPNINFVGDDVFTYLVRDEQGNVTKGTVTIDVTASSGPSPEEDDGNVNDDGQPTEVTPTDSTDPLPDAVPIESLRDEQAATTQSVLRSEPIDTITLLQPIELVQITRPSALPNSYLNSKSTETTSTLDDRSGYDLNDIASYTLLMSQTESWEEMTLVDQGLPLDLSVRDVSAGSAAAYVLGSAAGFGYFLFWLIRSGSIMSTLMTPAWSIMDPLPVLNCTGDLPRNDDDETLESLISKSIPAQD